MKKAFTAASVAKIKPPEKGRKEKFDGLLPGFGIRVTSNNHRSWIVLYKKNGRRKRYTIENVPVSDLAEARNEARRILDEVRAGGDPAKEKSDRKAESQQGDDPDTFTKVVGAFMIGHAGKKRRGWETKQIIERELTPHWGTRHISEITRRDVRVAVNRVMDRGSPRAANRLLSTIKTLFRWATDEDYIAESPATDIKPPGEKIDRDRVLQDNEVFTLWAAFDRLGYPFGSLMQMLLVTGQRLGEGRYMRWSDIDKDKTLWTLPRELTKADRSHEVPLSALALEILDELPRFAGDYVFTTTGGKIPVGGISRAKKRAEKFATGLAKEKPEDFPDVTNWRLHDLRRTCGTGIASLGIATSTISRVFNHKEGGVTKIYNRYSYLNEKRRALDAWANKLVSIIRPSDDRKVVAFRRS